MKKEEKKIQQLLEKINTVALAIGREVYIMEVCGTHTQAISRYGLRSILPDNIKLLSGPGCPVCVTAQEDIDAIVRLAQAGIPVATYGDVLRVPGYWGSLEKSRSEGAQVFSVYSVEEFIGLKKNYPDIVFFGIGFDTTAPLTGVALEAGVTVYSTHKLFLPAMKALLQMGEVKTDGFLSPGHVSAIIGTAAYENMGIAQVITGFEQEDVLVGIYMLLCQIRDGRKEVENEYLRAVNEKGNLLAQKAITDNFTISDGNWRGFGVIAKSGLEVKDRKLNAKIKYKKILDGIDWSKSKKPTGCRCGEVIRGLMNPGECPLFGKACTPEKPFGPCMVSEEGGCNVAYKYGHE